eukprot:scaffold4655_cov31-Tisochrysis_lutea.AAC.2
MSSPYQSMIAWQPMSFRTSGWICFLKLFICARACRVAAHGRRTWAHHSFGTSGTANGVRATACM